MGEYTYTVGGADDPALAPIDRSSFPQLEGSPKQIAWAQDIREGWAKEAEKMQEKYKNGIKWMNRDGVEGIDEYESRKEFAEGRRGFIAAARLTLVSQSSAKAIIRARNRFIDICCDVRDEKEDGASDDDIKKLINEWFSF